MSSHSMARRKGKPKKKNKFFKKITSEIHSRHNMKEQTLYQLKWCNNVQCANVEAEAAL